MGRTILVSNRIPIKAKKGEGKITIRKSEGGLATGLSAVHSGEKNLWVGWHGMAEEDIFPTALKDEFLDTLNSENFIPVDLTADEIENYYYGYSNRTIWPLFHYFTEYTEFHEKEWETYKKVNQKFAEKVLQEAEDDDLIWIHDYHLMLVPAILKKERPSLKIGFFLHIPFPSFEVFRMLPQREALLKGLLGADLIGFHTTDYQHYFIDSVTRLLDAKNSCDRIEFNNHIINTGVFPMGIDYEKFHRVASGLNTKKTKNQSVFQQESDRLFQKNKELKFILSIDRLDYTKGIAKRVRAFDYFLQQNPEYIEKVQLIMLAVPSRTRLEHYQLIKKEVDELVGRINSRYATPEWSPILYLFRTLTFENLVQLYANSDIALLTPIRDGMNLVAKEYLASRTDHSGVLILSEMAGASTELSEALLINPNDFEQISQTLKHAFEMPLKEQQKRNLKMQKRLESDTVFRWTKTFLDALEKENESKNQLKSISKKEISYLSEEYQKAERRLIFIDYDGTLSGFKVNPEAAVPTERVLDLLKVLGRDLKNDVYVVSGRKREFLENYFGSLGINLVAEHGAFVKNGFLDWKTLPGADPSGMEKIENLLQKFVAETPGSHIEKKSFSLAWHYRGAAEWGEKNAKNLYEILKRWSMDLNISILKGNKVIEITHPAINKGAAVRAKANCGKYDFILAIGDDHTDEYMFSAMPSCAHVIKVGSGHSVAQYRISEQKEVLPFLNRFAKLEQKKPIPLRMD